MKRYEKMRDGENLSWCKPYVSKDGKNAVTICECKMDGLMIDGEVIYWEKADKEEVEKRLAVVVNPNYSSPDYDGWDNLSIALDSMVETGCNKCPFNDLCDAMIDLTFN